MIGIDEVGRGAWAGPLLVVAAKAHGQLPISLTDSKKLSSQQRNLIMQQLISVCDFGEGWVAPSEIDTLGLSEAMRLAVNRALSMLGVETKEEIIMDGSINYCAPEYERVQCIIKADLSVPIVSAASVYAKVKRDEYMNSLGERYAYYQFNKHVGYGTSLHKSLLEQYGVSDLHRKSYKPIMALM